MGTPVLRLVSGSSAADSRAALRDLYARYGGSVYGRCSYLLKDATKAEDAMQDVFAKALTHLSDFRNEASPLTWLMKIATHHCLNLLRAERAPWHKRFEREELARGGEAPHSGPQLFEDREAVRKLLARCDLETQAAAIHYYVDEMTLEEVAALLGRSVPTVRKRLEAFATLSGEEVPR
jgi:RNA polymerase sigma-70 factor (ECF subfamily)